MLGFLRHLQKICKRGKCKKNRQSLVEVVVEVVVVVVVEVVVVVVVVEVKSRKEIMANKK